MGHAQLMLVALAAALCLGQGMASAATTPAPPLPAAASEAAAVEVAGQLLAAFTSVATELVTGQPDERVMAANGPPDLAAVNVSRIAATVLATALASWQMGVWDAPSNKGLRPEKFQMFDLWHYYQVPENPIGTVSSNLRACWRLPSRDHV